MKRRPVLIIAFACLASAIVALVFWPREREPEYNGVTLSTWLCRDTSGNRAEALAVHDAISHIGTNALPFLVRWIQYEPGWRESVAQKVFKWPVIRSNRGLQRIIVWNMTGYRAAVAVTAFGVLGSTANPAMPELQRLANSKSPDAARLATQCLILMTQRFPEGDFDRAPIIRR